MDDLNRFPPPARRKVGYQLFRVQEGDAPADWKPIGSIGQGVREIRIQESGGAFRVLYVAALGKTIYVLHCFQKKTQKTRTGDVELARRRYNELIRELEP